MSWLPLLVKASYFAAALLFILGIKRMASPKTAASGIRWAGAGMLVATFATFLLPGLHNIALIALAVGLGTIVERISGKKVAMTDMKQMWRSTTSPRRSAAAIARWSCCLLRGDQSCGFQPMRSNTHDRRGGGIGGDRSISLTGSISPGQVDGRMAGASRSPAEGVQRAGVLVAIALVLRVGLSSGDHGFSFAPRPSFGTMTLRSAAPI